MTGNTLVATRRVAGSHGQQSERSDGPVAQRNSEVGVCIGVVVAGHKDVRVRIAEEFQRRGQGVRRVDFYYF